MSNKDVRKKSQFSFKFTNLLLDTNGQHFILIGNAVKAITKKQ
ncbi:13655_t:CDS:2 [Funneliformis caledonium]|uniref:13655_t:CDS:1 n=1 Tax=Funneliformis caledonium TaxID=1117310 RepID=A0A9N8WAT1_9GLOM|nr:13655_t:CDS:2 [Funneliformis caledonium]